MSFMANNSFSNFVRLLMVGMAVIILTVFWRWSDGLDSSIKTIEEQLGTLVSIKKDVDELNGMHTLKSEFHLPEIPPHSVQDIVEMHNGNRNHPKN